jgi:hypothetical protein
MASSASTHSTCYVSAARQSVVCSFLGWHHGKNKDVAQQRTSTLRFLKEDMIYFGFDPGGIASFGWAARHIDAACKVLQRRTGVVTTAQDAINEAHKSVASAPSAVGFDAPLLKPVEYSPPSPILISFPSFNFSKNSFANLRITARHNFSVNSENTSFRFVTTEASDLASPNAIV